MSQFPGTYTGDPSKRGKVELPPQRESVGEKNPSGAPLSKEDPTNPESELESFLGVRMSKTQKWVLFLGLTAVFWTLIYNTTKKK